LAVLCCTVCLDAANAQSQPIVFGFVEDSTGSFAPLSIVSGRAFRDAVDYVNEHGGILGRPVKILVKNDESDATRTPSVTRQLIEDGANALFYSTSGSAVMQAKSVVRDAQIVSFAQATVTSAVASPPANEYMFSLGNASADLATALCGAWKALNIQKLGIFGDATPTADQMINGSIPSFERCVKIVAWERAAVDSNDVTAQVIRLKSAEPDAIVVISAGGQLEALAHGTIKRLLPSVKRFSTASLGNQPGNWKLAGPGALEGMVYTAAASLDNPRTAMIDEYFRKKHSDFIAVTGTDAWAWDAVMLAKGAIEKAGGVEDKAKVLEAMHSIKSTPTREPVLRSRHRV
jgi:branched-chain amino acid transport system substrate-binding protein